MIHPHVFRSLKTYTASPTNTLESPIARIPLRAFQIPAKPSMIAAKSTEPEPVVSLQSKLRSD